MGARLTALISALDVFRKYQQLHTDKKTPEGAAKAMSNGRMADQLQAAIAIQGDFAIGSDVWPGVSKLIEENGELGQVLGKLIGTGGQVNHWDGSNLAHRMEEEVADTLAAIDFVIENNPEHLKAYRIANRRNEKLKLFREWHRKVPPLPLPPGELESGEPVTILRVETFGMKAIAVWSDGYENQVDLRNFAGETEDMIRGRLESLRAQGQVSS